MSKNIRVFILSNLPLVRAGLRMLVNSHDGFTVVGEAGVSANALNFNGGERPQIAVLDVEPESASALDLLPELLNDPEPIRLIVLTSSPEPKLQQQAMRLGASGLVSKDKAPEILFKAIEKVSAGEVWFERATIASALGEMSRVNGCQQDDETSRIAGLSKREREVVTLIGEGLKNRQIADRLCLSEITVQHHLSSIFGKLGVADRLELVIYAYRYGLVTLPRDFSKKG